ncbi:uncharacterized protein EMH_0069870 [Eimeria mitis]|uniref:Uncharacterized protein n=1 Tax=Eimeria mitis TaxID=44415 RepID=U6KIU6_9EIME|nr:uncharacterized protein EMH_0069870 [Eimeria mitis]CDJ36207.1 hypothetical protein, conserved [Eimeria mitis]
MPSAFHELDGVSFSFGELQPISRISNDLQSRAYLPGSISTENDAASPGETESSLFIWNTATISTSPQLSSSASAHTNFTPVETFPLAERRFRHRFGADSAYRKQDRKYEWPAAKRFSRLHALAKSGTYWIGLAALALLVALTSAVDPLRAKLIRAGCEWARSDSASMQLSWDDDFLPRMPSRLRIQASRASEASKSSPNSFHTESKQETHRGSSGGAFARDSLLFDRNTRQPNEPKASFGPVNLSEGYDPVSAFSAAEPPRDVLRQEERGSASKVEAWRRSGTTERRERTIPQWRRYSPVTSGYYGYPPEPDADSAAERGSGYSTPLPDTLTDDVPSSSTDAKLDLRRSRSGSDSSSSNSGGQRNDLRQSRIDRKRPSTMQNRQRSSAMHRSRRRGNEVAEALPRQRRRTKVSRRSRVGTAGGEKQTAQSAPKKRWQRGRKSERTSLAKRYQKAPSVSVVSQAQAPKKTRFFLPESNVASGDASGEDDDSDEQETTSIDTHPAVLSSAQGATGLQSQDGDGASTSVSVNKSDESEARPSSSDQPAQGANPPSSTTAGQGDLAMATAATLLASGVSPDGSFNLSKNQRAACAGSNNASSLPTEVLLYLVRRALEELVSSENEQES